jgi:hypothetical protein
VLGEAVTLEDGPGAVGHYAITMHASQGVTADSCHAILGEGASRAMTYMAMTGSRHYSSQAYLQKLSHEADHEHASPTGSPQLHHRHRGDKYEPAQAFRTILANDARPITHARANGVRPSISRRQSPM